MAKDSIRLQAETLYIEDCLTAKEISLRIGATEKTIGKWVELHNWKERRLSKQSSPESFIKKYNDLLSALLDKRLRLEKELQTNPDAKEEYKGLIDEMSKISAMKEKLLHDGKLSLGTHVRCIERFMSALNKAEPKIFTQLLEFNKTYFTQLSSDLK
jgi:hypothetical protein